jgi:hypothetical protein
VLDAAIGVYAHEHGRTQRIRINLDLAIEDQAARPGGGRRGGPPPAGGGWGGRRGGIPTGAHPGRATA